MFKVLSIVGARPNFVKAAPMDAALKREENVEHILVHTGQHYDANLSSDLFDELGLSHPKYNLEIGSGRQAWQLGQMISKIDEVIDLETPDMIIAYGDTNSTAAGAIAAAKNNIPMAHVEAGLREFDKNIPEEVNKLLITASADLYFCPTSTGVSNLKEIGITKNVHLVGDIGIDLIANNLNKIINDISVLKKYNVEPKKYYFFTCHRVNNTATKEPLKEIINSLEKLSYPVVFPIHPRTEKAIQQFRLPHPRDFPHVRVIPPIGFFEAQTLIRFARCAITDSGGVVKEAYFHKTPGIIIDHQIEWIETVEEGWNRIAGPNCDKILHLSTQEIYPNQHSNCLGDGTASLQICQIIKEFLHASK